ncbi:hypothetical protein [Nocardia sp. XZ_19_231]|uniref:hypothetical protein n=1 Tax=Nocardia sp. XZ_19_231 TaxID=2769252 RepID=UPI00188F32F5|nr:hypothetical protein [Nocardia sp. XZ_19_231]
MRLRQLVVVTAAVMLGLTACQADPPQTKRVVEPAPTTTLPPVDASYWSTVPQTDEQRAAVSARARLIDVCALVPRAELVVLGEVRNVDNDETDSCRVELGPKGSVEKLSWASMVVFGDAPQPGATVQQLGDVALSVLPDDQGTGTTEKSCTFGVPVLTSCGFTYRGDDVVVSFENRESPTLSKTTEQMPDGRTAHVVDGTSYTVVVGPEFAVETGYFGLSAPAVNVFADTPDVAEDVMRHVLTLFPAT